MVGNGGVPRVRARSGGSDVSATPPAWLLGPEKGVNKPFVCTASLTIITSLYNVWITFAKCQRPRARLPSLRTAQQPKLTSIGKSDLSARPKRKYASLRNDGQINETGSSAHCHQLPKSKMFSIHPSIKLYYCKKMMK